MEDIKITITISKEEYGSWDDFNNNTPKEFLRLLKKEFEVMMKAAGISAEIEITKEKA